MQSLLNAVGGPTAFAPPIAAATAFIVTADGMAAPLSEEDGAPRAQPIRRALGLRDGDVASQLNAAIARAAGEARPGVVLWRKPCGTAVLLVVRPARTRGAAVVRVDPLESEAMQLEASTLAQLFGLSRSESQIAAALAADLSLAEIATSRGVGLETVRGQVKSLLRKMELNSQKQLVRVLTRIAVALA
jgi:DNA-binding CsgD family transcriptional regulator